MGEQVNRPIAIILVVVAIAFIGAGLLALSGCTSLGHGYQPPGAGIWKAL